MSGRIHWLFALLSTAPATRDAQARKKKNKKKIKKEKKKEKKADFKGEQFSLRFPHATVPVL
jgi:hypothetical protein